MLDNNSLGQIVIRPAAACPIDRRLHWIATPRKRPFFPQNQVWTPNGRLPQRAVVDGQHRTVNRRHPQHTDHRLYRQLEVVVPVHPAVLDLFTSGQGTSGQQATNYQPMLNIYSHLRSSAQNFSNQSALASGCPLCASGAIPKSTPNSVDIA